MSNREAPGGSNPGGQFSFELARARLRDYAGIEREFFPTVGDIDALNFLLEGNEITACLHTVLEERGEAFVLHPGAERAMLRGETREHLISVDRIEGDHFDMARYPLTPGGRPDFFGEAVKVGLPLELPLHRPVPQAEYPPTRNISASARVEDVIYHYHPEVVFAEEPVNSELEIAYDARHPEAFGGYAEALQTIVAGVLQILD
ncbi:MAG TPA: hypothetical protein VJP80_04350 [Candidatus Saccharimonadales bacterium]|nr:hypothetical protein [Candidatus Saccharimonadales bacterium]